MKKFSPSLLEKLFDNAPQLPAEHAIRRLSIDEVKQSVARDLEALLNSRRPFDEATLGSFNEASRSVFSFGLHDIAGACLTSLRERDAICRAIEKAVAVHEPRLRSVQVELIDDKGSIRSLCFSIRAVLLAKPTAEPVSFDALLQPSTQRYVVGQAHRSTALHA